MGLGRLLEACRVHEKVALEHSSKSAEYELESSYGDLVLEHVSALRTAKPRRECNEDNSHKKIIVFLLETHRFSGEDHNLCQ